MRGRESDIPVTLDLQDERASAFGHSIVFMRQAYPNAALMTYDDEVHRGAEQLLLCKLVFGADDPVKILDYESCDEKTTADNVRGGLVSRAICGDNNVNVGIYPLILPEDKRTRGGAAVVIKSDNPGIFVRFGCGNVAFMHFSPNEYMRGEKIDCEHGSASLENDAVKITREERRIVTYVKGGFDFEIKQGENGGSYAEGFCPGCEAYLTLGFSGDPDDAYALASLDGKDEIGKVKEYYDRKFKELYIQTPDDDINGAFEAAYLNLEYSWLYPYGWIESIQHWPTMWHMEQTGAEEWADNASRAKRTLKTQAEHIFENGAIPDMCTNDTGRRDWGGNNQFFFREVMHYLKMTDDREFAEFLLPYMRRVLAQTFEEYDAVGTGVLCWHSQIGNQEDFESTPGKGAAPGTEGVRMLYIMSEFLAYLGLHDEAEKYEEYASYAKSRLFDTLWRDDIGRFIWFSDQLGADRLDTTYHGICYPVIYGYVDRLDAASSLDHLKHRMTGPEGEVYQSNHFGDHGYWGVPTWGMQAGSDMQPFATAAYAAAGRADDAIKPLQFVARRVCGEFQRGAFPETANEKRFAYFSPSAGVFAQELIESVFGLHRDMISKTLTVSPCFPTKWDHASLRLPSVSYEYKKDGNTVNIKITSDDGCKKVLRMRTALQKDARVYCNNSDVKCEIKNECDFCELYAELTDGQTAEVTIELFPLEFSVECDGTAACGDTLDVKLSECEITGVVDREGIFDDASSFRLKRGILDAYKKYGAIGLVNFSRRTFALKLKSGDVEFLYPVSLTVTPAYEIKATYDGVLHVVFRNYSKQPVNGTAQIFTCGKTVRFPLMCKAKETAEINVACTLETLHGKNRALFITGGKGEEFDLISDRQYSAKQIRIDGYGAEEYANWRKYGMFQHHGCAVMGPDEYLKNVPDRITVGGAEFELSGKFIPVSSAEHRIADIKIDRDARKLYVLISAFSDDHEVFCEAFSAEIWCKKEKTHLPPVYVYPLTVAGALDFGFSNSVLAGFGTFAPGTKRNVPLPSLKNGDYEGTLCPDYPQRELWCNNEAVEAGGAVFNLLEFDIGVTRRVERLTVVSKAQDGAAGIFAVAAEK